MAKDNAIQKAKPRGMSFEAVNDRAVVAMAVTEISTWPRIDYRDPAQVAERLELLFQHSAERGIYVLPSTIAIALGTTDRQVRKWRSGEARQNPEVLKLINQAYENCMASLQAASLLGQVQPLQALAIQHNMGMQDNPDKVKETADEDDRSATAQDIMIKYADMPDE